MKNKDMSGRSSGSGLTPLKIAIIYAAAGGIWIFFSDRLLDMLMLDPQLHAALQTYKGWLYVSLTSLLLYGLVNRYSLEQRRTEEELRDSEERYHSLFQNSIDAVLLTSPDGSILAANAEACRVFQMTEDEICSGGREGVADMTDPRLPAAIAERERSGRFRGELTFIRKDGSKFPGEISSAIYTDRHGNRRTAMIIRDVSARVQAEQRTSEALNYIRTMLEASPAGIITYSAASGAVISANEAAATIIGATLEQVKGQNFRMIESWKESGLLAAAERALSIGEEQLIETHFITTFGKEVWLSCRFVPFRYADEDQLLLLFLDVTERRLAEQAVWKSEERFRSLFENMLDGFAYCRMIFEGDRPQDFVYLEVNSAFERLTGLKDVAGRRVSEVIPGIREAYPELFETYGRVSMTGRPERFEMYLEPIKAWLNISVYSTEKEHFIAVFDNVTEHKTAEEQLRQAQKMEAVGQLAGGIAHDFNNVLSAIIGFGSLMQMKISKDDPLKENVDQILESADRAVQLTRSLLAFSRKQVMDLRPVDLNEVVRKMEKFLVRIIGEDIEFRISCHDRPLNILADASQMEQVLMNLAANARDAMPRGGKLSISTQIARIPEEPDSDFAEITVADTGSGMDEETRKKIFEPFFTTKEVGKGTGLGLAMIYGIVKQHSGHIKVNSEPGIGTTFRIFLPLTGKKAEAAGSSDVDGYPAGGSETVLVAEDDEGLRKLTSTVLREFGYTVITAEDGQDAVEKFAEQGSSIRLCVLDMIMPRKSGKEACDYIRQLRPDMKVIFTSGYTGDFIEQKGLREGDFEFIMKPVSPRDLLRKVREMLDGKQTNSKQ